MKNIYKFLLILGWPFLLCIGVGLWYESTSEEREAKKRREILSDTAAVNQAYRTYERVHRQQLMEDPDYSELYEKYEGIKDRILSIRGYVSDAEDALFDIERQGIDVSELEDILSNISSECE